MNTVLTVVFALLFFALLMVSVALIAPSSRLMCGLGRTSVSVWSRHEHYITKYEKTQICHI